MERRRTRYTARRALLSPQPQRPNLILRCIVAAFVIMLLLLGGVGAASTAYIGKLKLPPLGLSGLNFENTQIFAADHRLLYDLPDPQTGNRVLRPLELSPNNHRQCPNGWRTRNLKPYYACSGWGIPVMLRDATIATEDPTFYSNPGFDPLSMLRATYQDLTSGQIQSGASTITQQFVKQYILHDNAPNFTRKVKEIILAWQLTNKYPKDFILYYYLNSVYYGNLSYGVEAAAQGYFHVGVQRLKLWQDAVIAGLPQSPNVYNPFNDPRPTGPWYSRMLEVLNYMQERGYITHAQEVGAEQQAQIYSESAHFHRYTPRMQQPDFVVYAIDQFNQMTNPSSRYYDPYLVTELTRHHKSGLYDGLKLFTTIHPGLQALAQQTVHNQIASLGGQNVTDGALVSISTQPSCYGCIMTMIGSAGVDQSSRLVNMANSPRQPGSSFKVFNYVSAIAKGLAPATTVVDAPLHIPDKASPSGVYSPTNYDHTFHGQVTLRSALANSLNVPAVKVELFNGVKTIARTAHRFGISDLWRDNPHCCPGNSYALTLGGMDRGVRLVEETAAYGAFATQGIRVTPISFNKIVDRSTGKVIWRASSDTYLKHQRMRVASAADTFLVDSILRDDNARTMEFGYNSPLQLNRFDASGHETAAAKTGTTNNYTDNWTVGFTPQLVTGVWVGNANDQPMINSTGITGAAPIWHDFMLAAIQRLHLPVVGFVEPPGVTRGTQCRVANQPPGTYATYADGLSTTSVTPYCSVPTVQGLDDQASTNYYATPQPISPPVQYYQPVQPNPQPQQVVPVVTPVPVSTPSAPNIPQLLPGQGNGNGNSPSQGNGNPQSQGNSNSNSNSPIIIPGH